MRIGWASGLMNYKKKTIRNVHQGVILDSLHWNLKWVSLWLITSEVCVWKGLADFPEYSKANFTSLTLDDVSNEDTFVTSYVFGFFCFRISHSAATTFHNFDSCLLMNIHELWKLRRKRWRKSFHSDLQAIHHRRDFQMPERKKTEHF